MQKLIQYYKQNPSEELRNNILKKFDYKSLVSSFCFSTGNLSEIEDYNQEALITINKCIDKYQPDKKAKFTTFAYTCVLNHLKNLNNKAKRGISFASIEDWGDFISKTPAKPVNGNIRNLREVISKCLSSEEEEKVLKFFSKNRTKYTKPVTEIINKLSKGFQC